MFVILAVFDSKPTYSKEWYNTGEGHFCTEVISNIAKINALYYAAYKTLLNLPV